MPDVLHAMVGDNEIKLHIDQSAVNRENVNSLISPLDQFIIKDFFTCSLSFGLTNKLLITNMSIYLLFVTCLSYGINLIYNKLKALISST